MKSASLTMAQLCRSKLAWHKKYESGLFKRNLNYYQHKWVDLFGDELDEYHKNTYTFNIIYAMVSSAIAEIVGNRPRAFARAVQPSNKLFEHDVNIVMDWVAAESNLRKVMSLAITDAALKRRGCLKRAVNPSTRLPRIRKVNPERLHFDMAVQMPRDSAYWLESVLMPWSDFVRLVKTGQYDSPKLKSIPENGYSVPKWMREAVGTDSDDYNGIRYITVWELYDAWSGKVKHYHLESDAVLFEGEVTDHPYSMFSLIPNGQDMVGISEAEAIMAQQYLVNSQMNLWHDTIDASVGGVLADGSIIDGSSIEKVASAGPDRLTVVNRTAEGRRNRRMTLREAFMDKPVPQHPEQNKQLLEVVLGHAQQLSGYAPGKRGQFENVRTAREVAFVEASMRNLISHKIGEVEDAFAEQFKKCWDLIVRYAPNGIHLHSREQEGGYVTLGDWLGQAAGMQFEMVPYNPIRHNPAVQAETILGAAEFFMSNPHYDKRALAEVVHRGLGLPDAVLRDQAEVIAEAEQQAQAKAAAAGGGGTGLPGLPGGGPPPGAELEPEVEPPPMP